MFEPENQECDLLRDLMQAANAKGFAGALGLEGRAIAEIVFLRRLNRDAGVIIRILAEIASGEMKPNDIIARRALEFLDELRFDWSAAPIVFDPPAQDESFAFVFGSADDAKAA
jgi:hypothetical protein